MLAATDPLPRPPQRVLVAGVSGVGKTTLARRIAARLPLEHTEIDALFHGPGWTPRPTFEADIAELAARQTWLTEWQYSTARGLLASRADLLVWLDLPYPITFTRVVSRTIRRRRTHEVLWNDNVEPGIWHAVTAREGIVRWSFSTRRKYSVAVPALEAQHPHLLIVRLRTRREVEEWLQRLG
jgi:adenylate kinase family enzyme